MRKKIILIFAICILATTFLTGCGDNKTILPEQVETMNKIAKSLKESSDYKLEDGYTFFYPDNSSNSMITVKKGYMTAIYDMSAETPELIKIEIDCTSNVCIGIFYGFIIVIGIILILLVCCI